MTNGEGINQRTFMHSLWTRSMWGWAWGRESVGLGEGGDGRKVGITVTA